MRRSLALIGLFVVIGYAAITFSLITTIDCFAQGCESIIPTSNGADTRYFTAWSDTGTWSYNGATIGGQLLGTFNDGSTNACGAIPAGGSIGVIKLTVLDFTTPANTTYADVNCMAAYGTPGYPGWAPAADYTCTVGVVSGCNWKTVGITHVNGKVYLWLLRQDGPTGFEGHDATLLMSDDEGAHWCNFSTIAANGGTCPHNSTTAAGDMPPGPGSGSYPSDMLWPEASPFNGSNARMSRGNFVNYCRDESIGCPSIDNNATYTYAWSTGGQFSGHVLMRWPKTDMPTLNISTAQYYVCPGYATTVCDGSVSGNWTSTLASATVILSSNFGAFEPSIIWDNGKNLYVGSSWDGNGTNYIFTAPHVWGPFTIGFSFAPTGVASARSTFVNFILPTLSDTNSTTTNLVLANTSVVSGGPPGGGGYFYRFNMTVPASGGGGGPVTLSGKVKASGKIQISTNQTGGAITGLTVIGTNSTQALVSYTAPDTNACTMAVSESVTYLPVVNDLSTTLYTGANSDTRDGNLSSGAGRVVLIGRRAAELALDSKYYSRALQANTLHYLKVVCTGGATAVTTFTTANIPGGLTHQDIPKISSSGTYILPTVAVDDRTVNIVDQYTGALMKPLTIRSDRQNGSVDGFNSGFGGFVRSCTAGIQTDTNTGQDVYVCQQYSTNAEGTSIFSIDPLIGLVTKLGFLGPTASFGHVELDSDMCFVVTDNPVTTSTQYCYDGDWTEQPSASLVTIGTYSTASLQTQLAAFDVTYDASLFPCSNIPTAGPDQYSVYSCGRAGQGQDAYGWLVEYSRGDGRVYDPMCTPAGTTCPGIVAAFLSMNNNTTRFCGTHNDKNMTNYPVNPVDPWLFINWHGLTDNGHISTANWASTMTAGMNAVQTTISVAGNPANVFGGDTFVPAVPGYVIGDIITFGGPGTFETQSVTAVSGTGPYTLTITRTGSNVQTHNNGDAVIMQCNTQDMTGQASGGWKVGYWTFLSDIHGADVTNTNLVQDCCFDPGGHLDDGPNGRITEGPDGWEVVPGAINRSSLDIAIPLNILDGPTFHGLRVPCNGGSCVKHPSYHPTTDASATEQLVFTDQSVFNGGDLFFGPSTNPATLVSGSLYKYLGATDPSYSAQYANGLWRKVLPTIAVTGGTPYADISSPATGNVISTGSGDNWKYCVALKANECRTGSSVGDIYFNTGTTLSFLYCTSADSPQPNRKDICITAAPTYANALPQLLTSATNQTNATRRSRVLGHGLRGPRQGWPYPSSKSLPDGSWSLFYAMSAASINDPTSCSTSTVDQFCNTWIIKNPPFPAQDAYDRSDFIPTTVTIASVPATTTNVIVRFGYLEQGTSAQFYCTSRAEACVVNSATIAAAPDLNPFRYPVEGTGGVESGLSGVSCSSSCSVNLPTISGRVVYYQIVYRDGSNATVSTGPLTTAVVP